MIRKNVLHYKIIEKIGEGGMGEVYLAEDAKLERKVAIKFLPQHLTKDKENVERFEREAKAAASLNHPNIITIHEVNEFDDQIFIVMEYVEGQTLRELLIADCQLPTAECIDISTQICQGLSKAHAAGIIHRDIKPENILIDKDGRIKILDFGLAKLKGVSKLTKESSTLGTVHYMSPEQIQGREVDQRSDIWSVGVLLYEMLTGEVPFHREYEQAVTYAILNEEPKISEAIVPDRLMKIFKKCLQKNPDDRYQDIKGLIYELQGVGDKSTDDGVSKISTKKRLTYISIIASALILIVIGYLLIPLRESERSEKGEQAWENSIAVLPFKDNSPAKDQEFFANGVAEQIRTNLSNLNRLKVIAHQSILKYKNTDKTIPQIGSELNISNILEGSVSRIGNRIRVITQLVKSEDGAQLWAQNYDYSYELDSSFAIYDDISEKIARVLLEKLSPKDIAIIQSDRPRNKEAHELYMRGNYYYWRFFSEKLSKDDFIRSETMYKNAIEIDSTFAPIYANMAVLYSTYFYQKADFQTEKSKYLDLIDKYLEIGNKLNPDLTEIPRVKGWLHYSKKELAEAYRYFRKSVNISPNNRESNRALGVFFRQIGIPDKSLKYFNKAIELDPQFVVGYISRAMAWEDLQMFNKASLDFKSALEIERNSVIGMVRYVTLLLGLEKFKAAEELIIRGKKIDQERFKLIWDIYMALMKNERLEMDVDIFLNEIFDLPQRPCLYLKLKNHPLICHSTLESLRNKPRFQEILANHKELYEENLRKYGNLE